MAAPETSMLALDHVSKRFGGVQALHDVSLSLTGGTVLALAGENGAGKSTLMKILTGIYHADEGRILLDGRELDIDSPMAAQRAGLSIVHQELNLFPNLSVAENISIGREPNSAGWIKARVQRRDAEQHLAKLGINVPAGALVGRLSIAEQQMVEIAKAVSVASRFIVMDEPTSSLTERETDVLFALIRRLRGQGLGIVYISHRMEELFLIADHIAVMRDGQMVAQWPVAKTTREEIVAAMVGRPLSEFYQKVEAPIGNVVLEVRGLDRAPSGEGEQGRLLDISFNVRAGEIVGLAGLTGAGRTELARTLFGADHALRASISVGGRRVRIGSPADAIRAGFGLVPEDRKNQALFLAMTVRENITLAGLRALSVMGWIDAKKERAEAIDLIARLSIRTAGPEQAVVDLSGGNQQKAVLARWIAMRPKVLILDEPTRGVDVGAKTEIHRLIGEMVAAGTAVLVISSELPEVLSLADRILVMARGRIAAELPRSAASAQAVMAAATAEAEAAA
jgi:ribose transport system ATP-binding protein